jgi:iron complex transport system substrate-binding protein
MLIPVTHSKSPTVPTNRHPVSSTSRLFVAAILILTLLAALASSAARAPVRAEPVEIEHVRGRVSLPTAPETVVVFDLASLDVLDALGVKVAGVPRGPKPAYLAKYQDAKYPKMGTLFEPDYEAVSALSPDLIVVGLRSWPKFEALSKIAPTIDLTIDPAHLVDSAKRHALTLARLFGKDAEATARIAKLDAAIGAVRARAATAGTGLIVLTTGGRVSAFGPGSRFGVIHDTFGVKPAAPEIKVGLHGQPISFEFIRKVNPDWLFVLDRDAAIDMRGQPSRQLLDNELVHETTAWRKNQVIYLDAASFYLVNGGLTALQAMVDHVGVSLAAAR